MLGNTHENYYWHKELLPNIVFDIRTFYLDPNWDTAGTQTA